MATVPLTRDLYYCTGMANKHDHLPISFYRIVVKESYEAVRMKTIEFLSSENVCQNENILLLGYSCKHSFQPQQITIWLNIGCLMKITYELNE